MPRWNPDFAGARATIRVYERGDYEVKFGSPRPFVRENREGKVVSGVRYPLEMVGRIQADGSLDKEFEGEQVAPISLYIHNEDGWGIAKRILMAVLGYNITPEAEDEFDNDVVAQGVDFGVDGDVDEEVTAGDGWKKLQGGRAIVSLSSQKPEGYDRVFQQHGNFVPVKG